jgi:hypothetical protein
MPSAKKSFRHATLGTRVMGSPTHFAAFMEKYKHGFTSRHLTNNNLRDTKRKIIAMNEMVNDCRIQSKTTKPIGVQQQK